MKRLLARSSHLLRLVLKSVLYSFGFILVKPIIQASRLKNRLPTGRPLRILYVMLGYRGDFILNLPALDRLRSRYPDARLTCWINEFNLPLARLWGKADDFITYRDFNASGMATAIEVMRIRRHREFLRDLRARRYDVMIDDSGSGFAAMMATLARIPRRISRNAQGYGFLNHFDFPEDVNEQLVLKRLKLLQAVDVPFDSLADLKPRLTIEGALISAALADLQLAPQSYFTIQPFGGWSAKNWSAQNVANLIKAFVPATGLRPVLLGAPAESDVLAEIASNSGTDCVVAGGRLTLTETAAVIAGARLHFGVDSVGSHLATAVGTASLTLFGPTNPYISHFLSPRHVAMRKLTRCTPRPSRQYCCFDAGRTCRHEGRMNELQVEEVLQTLLAVCEGRSMPPVVEY